MGQEWFNCRQAPETLQKQFPARLQAPELLKATHLASPFAFGLLPARPAVWNVKFVLNRALTVS
jgi:hypothetical protein